MKPKYTLKDFDLLVAKVKHLRKKQEELKKEADLAVDALTEIMVENDIDELSTTQGFKVYRGGVFEESLAEFYSADSLKTVRRWCCDNDMVSINSTKFKASILSSDPPPFPTPELIPRAFFRSITNGHAKPLDINKEIERAYMTAKKDRLPHMQLLRDAGLSYQKIADIYGMSKTQARRDLNKKQTVRPKSIYSSDL